MIHHSVVAGLERYLDGRKRSGKKEPRFIAIPNLRLRQLSDEIDNMARFAIDSKFYGSSVYFNGIEILSSDDAVILEDI